MKKWFAFFSLSFALVFSLSACQHDTEQPEPPASGGQSCRLDSIVHAFDGYSYSKTFLYYPDGKIRTVSAPSESSTYTYENNRVIESISTLRYPAPAEITYELGTNGMTSRAWYEYYDEESNTIYDTIAFTYNSEGYLVKKVLNRTILDYENQIAGTFETITTLVISNGNTVEERKASSGSYGDPEEERVSARYEYYLNQEQKEEGFQPPWLGKQNKHLLKKATTYSAGNPVSTTDYSYVLNEKGYVATATVNGEKQTYYHTCR
jgi:hypothetical protein